MADLSEVLGAVLASITQARRIADEETAALVEHYRSTPLLEGMTLPRIRLPEVVLEIPVLIEDFRETGRSRDGRPDIDPADVTEALACELTSSAERLGVRLPKVFTGRFEKEVARELARFAGKRPSPLTVEGLVRATSTALSQTLCEDRVERFDTAGVRTLQADLGRVVHGLFVPPDGPPLEHSAGIDVTVLTEAIKERGWPGDVARLRLTLREEGMEWTTVDGADGERRLILTPE